METDEHSHRSRVLEVPGVRDRARVRPRMRQQWERKADKHSHRSRVLEVPGVRDRARVRPRIRQQWEHDAISEDLGSSA
jgi:hypothetical protein